MEHRVLSMGHRCPVCPCAWICVYGKEKREPNDAWHLYFTLNYHFDDVDLNRRVNALPRWSVPSAKVVFGDSSGRKFRTLLGDDHCCWAWGNVSTDSIDRYGFKVGEVDDEWLVYLIFLRLWLDSLRNKSSVGNVSYYIHSTEMKVMGACDTRVTMEQTQM